MTNGAIGEGAKSASWKKRPSRLRDNNVFYKKGIVRLMTETAPKDLQSHEIIELGEAVKLLENQGFAALLSNIGGKPIVKLLEVVPGSMKRKLDKAVQKTMLQCLDVAVNSLETAQKAPPKRKLTTLVSTITGGVSGMFGMASLPVELPFSTVLTLRSIAEIARSHGENLQLMQSKLACMEVLALGAPSSDNGSVSSYFTSRRGFAKFSNEAGQILAEHGVSAAASPAVNGFISEIATRFSAVVYERAAAGAVPLVGVIGGAASSAIFMNYFQELAQGHFIVRKLEKIYGPELIEKEYMQILKNQL